MYFGDKKKKKFFGKKSNVKKANRFGESEGFFSRSSAYFLGAAIGLGVASGAFFFYREAVTTPVFAVDKIEFKGVVRSSESEILEASGIKLEQNIFTVRGSAAEEAIKSLPYVRGVKVVRKLPSEMIIDVTERVPLFLVKGDSLYVMDSEGQIFKKYEREDKLDLPVITGPSGKGSEGWLDEMKGKLMVLVAALDKSEHLKTSSISEIHVDPVMGFSVYTLKEGVRIDFGMDDFDLKLTSFVELLNARGGSLVGVEAIDLNNKKGVVVRFTTAAV